MAIRKLEFHGYRSFEKAVWEPGRLNLLVGPNGSGKSNLLRLLELISNTAAGGLAKSINAAGGMVPLLWDQRADSFGWELTCPGFVRDSQEAIHFEVDIAHTHGSSYRLATDGLSRLSDWRHDQRKNIKWSCLRKNHTAWVRGSGTEQSATIDLLDDNESLISQVTDPHAKRPLKTASCLKAWRVHHDVEVGASSSVRQPVTTQYAKQLEPDGSNLAAVLHTLYTSNRDFKQEIDDGMRAAFGPEYVELVFQPAAAQMIQLGVQWRSSKQPHSGNQLSDGTLRLLFLLTLFANPDPPPLIAIDEPDVGLHPSMLSIVAEYAVSAAERTQVVITTHSPEFLDVFTEHQPNVTLCHWEDGRSRLFAITPDRLQPWLKEYRLGHLFTSGELDILAAPDVDPIDDADERFGNLPPEGLPVSSGEEMEGPEHE